MKPSKKILVILSATLFSFCLNFRSVFAGEENKSSKRDQLADRINTIRKKLKDHVDAGETKKLKDYNISDRLLNTWGNWGNWGNWNNWNNWAKWTDWNNWRNWGNWGNY